MFAQRSNARKSSQRRHLGQCDGDLPAGGQSGARASEPAFERRRQPPPTTPREYLNQLPALPLLNRLPTPVVAVGLDGEIIYANPAFATWLGYPEVHLVTGQPLSQMMLVGREDTSAQESVSALRAAAGTVATWRHADGYHQHAVVSEALLVRANDPLLLVTLSDVTEILWNSNP